MFKKITLLFLFMMVTITVFSQQKREVLLTINDQPVYTKEFKRVYKKNLDLVQEESQKDVAGYLELFIDYKLKIIEAHNQNLHNDPTYIKEFSQYQEQLSRNYLYENKMTDDLALEAYERGLEEINASHILILSSYEDLPQDTLTAYNKIKKIRERALSGEDFLTLAKETSEEPSAKEHGGELGYFSVFALVYPFETMAYNTPVGEISNIVRTQFGYHIIKVNDRRKRSPEITVSHIMISDKEDPSRTFDPEVRIQEIYSLLQQGESFENLAKQYSDDKNSGKRGGKLTKFTKGDLRSEKFEEAAYAIKEVGEISKPVKTNFGWHIIRLDEKHGLGTFEEKKESLVKRVQDANRLKIVTHKVNNKIKDKYGYTLNEEYKDFFENYLTDDVLQRKWEYDSLAPDQNKRLFTIGDKELTYRDLASYIFTRQRRSKSYKTKQALLAGMFDEFETLELKNYFRDRLEFENEEYAAIISEYRDGLLIFDVMNKNIWNKAKNDSIGLKAYYDDTKEQYTWNERVDAIMVSSTDSSVVRQAGELLKQGKTADEIKQQFNTKDKVIVIVSNGIYEIGKSELPDGFVAVEGVSDIFSKNDSFSVLSVTKIIPPSLKSLEEVRGRVLSNYQNYLEQKWLQELRSKCKIEINKKALKKTIKSLKA
jgi:peptidyl-prolyl cis-trans isomerase SurA